jgi:hypothetical protein
MQADAREFKEDASEPASVSSKRVFYSDDSNSGRQDQPRM